jgi:hypothetical protein
MAVRNALTITASRIFLLLLAMYFLPREGAGQEVPDESQDNRQRQKQKQFALIRKNLTGQSS